MANIYKLRECIEAHESDVKSICTLSNGYGFISASRDYSVRLWKEECDTFKQEKKFLFHKHFISSVIYMNPSLRYGDGIILSAGYDKLIYGISPLSNVLEFSLTGHTDTVTSLSVNGTELVSGSMDKTAIMWNLITNSIESTFKGHAHGIWSVILLQSIQNGLLTGSADKDIFLWDTKTQTRTKRFSGHTDCVRNIVEIPEQKQFLSCSNDATIRLWSLNHNTCLKEFIGHTAYIYSIALMPEGDTFVSCGEGGMVFLWDIKNPAKPKQNIVHKTQSVWCVSTLNNGDIITGSSDGRIRLFSKNPEFQNGIEPLAAKSKDSINNTVVEELPTVGIEQLIFPGDYDGQFLKVLDEDKLILYTWSVLKQMWVKMSVMDNGPKDEKKTHDYVFSIDIKDGEPPIKLPYNKGQDPWVVAQKFLEDNDLNPQFLDQVAKFIINNTTPAPAVVTTQTEFSDPFTGGNRYVPDISQQIVSPKKMFPQKTYLEFEKINVTGLSKKIVEIMNCNVVPENILSLIENIHNISSKNGSVLTQWTIDRISECDIEFLFPLIDILRMLVRETEPNNICFATPVFLLKMLDKTLNCHGQCSKGNMLTMVKWMCNAFSHTSGENVMMNMFQNIADILIRLINVSCDKSLMNAISSWFLNIGVLINSRNDEDKRILLVDTCFILLSKVSATNCSESVLRVLVTIGTLVCNNDSFTFRENLTVGVFDKINNLTKLYQDKSKWTVEVNQCGQQLAELVSSLDLFNF